MTESEWDCPTSQHRILAVEQSVSEAIVSTDAERRILSWNTAAEIMFGYPPKQVIGQSFELLFPERLRAEQQRLIKRFIGVARPNPSGKRLEMILQRAGGSELSANLVMTRWIENERVFLTASIHDLTATKEAEAILEREISFQQALLKAQSELGIGAAIWNTETQSLIFVNEAICRLLGYAESELLVASVEAIFADARPNAALVGAERTPTTPAHRRSETVLRHKNGTRIEVEISHWPLEESRKIVALIRDNTERNRNQARLMHADRMTSMGSLAAGVAHEINNPLSFVLSNLDFVSDGLSELAVAGASAIPSIDASRLSELREAVADAKNGADRVRRIVRDIKNFSRSEDAERALVDVKSVLEFAINMSWNEIRHRARLVKEYGTVPSIVANEGRLGQVFINLLVNAAQAIPDGNAEANEIRITTSTREDGSVTIAIRDTGSGVAKENLARIFEPFFTTKPIGVGTGLGLAVCHGIVNELGGELTVESELQRGTTFRVTLPQGSASFAPSKRHSSLVPGNAAHRGRILIVDDEAQLGKAYGRAIALDHEVVVETTARAALTRIRQGERYDAILCDVMMPEMTGVDLFTELARDVPEQAAEMIFMTGGTFAARAYAFLEEVSNPRFEKPLDMRMLRSLLRERLRTSRS